MRYLALLFVLFTFSCPAMARPHRIRHFEAHRISHHEARHLRRYEAHHVRRFESHRISRYESHHVRRFESHRRRASRYGGRGSHSGITCEMVRAYVAKVGLSQAITMAKSAGMTSSDEQRARRCLSNKI
jgi:hypothetical protein